MTPGQAFSFHHFKELTPVRQNLARGAGDPQDDEAQSAEAAEPPSGSPRRTFVAETALRADELAGCLEGYARLRPAKDRRLRNDYTIRLRNNQGKNREWVNFRP